MKYKLILILVVSLLITGCAAKYEVEIKDNNVIEKESMVIDKDSVGSDGIYYTINRMVGKYFLSADFLIGDTKEYYEQDKAIYQKTNKIEIDDYNDSDIFDYCYDAHNVLIEEKYIIISTSDEFKCFNHYEELDNVQIVLKTNHKVVESNADSVDGYIYTWNLNKNNYSNARIYIKLYKDKYVFNYENEFYKKIALYGGIGCAIIGIGLFIFFKFVRKRKTANKI